MNFSGKLRTSFMMTGHARLISLLLVFVTLCAPLMANAGIAMLSASSDKLVESSSADTGQTSVAQGVMSDCHESGLNDQPITDMADEGMSCCLTGDGCQHEACELTHCQVPAGLTSQLYPSSERNVIVSSQQRSAYLSQTPELLSPPPIL